MARTPERVVWDACCFIAHIQQERLTEDRAALCRAVLGHASARGLEIVTSTLVLAEVRKVGIHPDADTEDKIASFFDQPFILIAPLDRWIGRKARELGRRFGLKPQDAVYLATAVVLDVPVLHSFDNGLLATDGQLQTDKGRPLRVCWPEPPLLPPAPLLDDPAFGTWA